uniref:Secreted protein n=1 Tax=Eutreptiella gymnastica TaxID=73025 RepID=A0A7S4LBN8_9EUGL
MDYMVVALTLWVLSLPQYLHGLHHSTDSSNIGHGDLCGCVAIFHGQQRNRSLCLSHCHVPPPPSPLPPPPPLCGEAGASSSSCPSAFGRCELLQTCRHH